MIIITLLTFALFLATVVEAVLFPPTLPPGWTMRAPLLWSIDQD